PVPPGPDRDAGDTGTAANGDGASRPVFEPRQYRHGRMNRRIPDPLAEAQGSGVIGVAVAQQHGIDPADGIEIREAAGLWSLATVEQQPTLIRFDDQSGRLPGAGT